MTEVATFTEEEVRQVQEHYKDIQNGPLSPTQSKVLLVRCKSASADPLAGHIIPQLRNSKDDDGNWVKRMVLVTSIDFLRLVADRTGEYSPGADTQFGPEWGPGDKAIGFPGCPQWARSFVRKYAKNTWHEYSSQAFFREYVQLTRANAVTSTWAKMPYVMIEKCAEAKALRRGFPNELQGLYSHEEMDQADSDTDVAETPKAFGVVPRKVAGEVAGQQGGGQQSDPPPPVNYSPRFCCNSLEGAYHASNCPRGGSAEKALEKIFGAKVVATVPLSPQGEATLSQEKPTASTAPPTPPDSSPVNVTQSLPIIPPPIAPLPVKETNPPKLNKCINKPQRDRLWAIMKDSKRTKDDLKSFLKTIKTQDHPDGIESTNDIPANIYEVVCAFIEGGK